MSTSYFPWSRWACVGVIGFESTLLFFALIEAVYGYGFFADLSLTAYLVVFITHLGATVMAALLAIWEWRQLSGDPEPSLPYRLIWGHLSTALCALVQVLLITLFKNHYNDQSPSGSSTSLSRLDATWRTIFTFTLGTALSIIRQQGALLLELVVATENEDTSPTTTTTDAPPTAAPLPVPLTSVSTLSTPLLTAGQNYSPPMNPPMVFAYQTPPPAPVAAPSLPSPSPPPAPAPATQGAHHAPGIRTRQRSRQRFIPHYEGSRSNDEDNYS